eukprot:4590918-Alexandrium_andersonii.AAC.1
MRRSAAFIGMARVGVLQVLGGGERRGCRCSGISCHFGAVPIMCAAASLTCYMALVFARVWLGAAR